MPGKLHVSFNSPQCGFMSIGFADDRSEFHTTTAHTPHERALGELLRILTALVAENREPQESVLYWSRDPEEFDFRFLRNGETVLMEIYQYPTGARAEREREKVFAHEGNAREVSAAFAETFRQLDADRDTDEFEFNWRQPFPDREYEEFTRALDAAST